MAFSRRRGECVCVWGGGYERAGEAWSRGMCMFCRQLVEGVVDRLLTTHLLSAVGGRRRQGALECRDQDAGDGMQVF
jgi:hypothetical protein